MLHLLCILGVVVDITEKIERTIEPSLADMGYEVVRIQIQGAKRKTLQVMIDRLDGQPVTITDCTQSSHTISALLEVEDPLQDAYNLEVSSPGMDRPLVKLKDFERFSGESVRLELKFPVEGRRRFQGRLEGVKDGKVLIHTEDESAISEFEFEDIQKANILPSYE